LSDDGVAGMTGVRRDGANGKKDPCRVAWRGVRVQGKRACLIGYPGDDGLEKLNLFEFESGIDDSGDPAQEYGKLQKLFHNSN
jgi:hypothetical protein